MSHKTDGESNDEQKLRRYEEIHCKTICGEKLKAFNAGKTEIVEFCIVARIDDPPTLERLTSFQRELRKALKGRNDFFLKPSLLHVSIGNPIEGVPADLMSEETKEEYYNSFKLITEEVIRNHDELLERTTLSFKGVTLAEDAILVRGFNGGSLNALNDQLIEAWRPEMKRLQQDLRACGAHGKEKDIEGLLERLDDSHDRLGHLTITNFKVDTDEIPRRLLDCLETHKVHDFGSFPISSISMVWSRMTPLAPVKMDTVYKRRLK